jgi:hypothetical protein
MLFSQNANRKHVGTKLLQLLVLRDDLAGER